MEPPATRGTFNSICKAAVITSVLLLSTGGGCSNESPESGKAVIVYAGAGTMKAMEEIASIFTAETGYKADFEFSSSGSLAKKIAAGAPCDLYVSASRDWIDYLTEKNLLDPRSIKTIAESELVCVVPKNSASGGSTPGDLARLGKIALGDPAHVPVGKYARQALRSLRLWDTLSLDHKLVLAPTVMQALYLAERGEVDAAIVFLGDAKLSDRVEIAFKFPENTHQPIEFIGAVVSSSTSGPAPGAFLDFLSTKRVARVFTRHGFRVP